MSYRKSKRSDSTITIRVMCAIVFVVFSLSWLYAFQADVLAMTQNVLSEGLTNYDKMVGAIVITVSLYVLQLIVNGITRMFIQFHALTYAPSMLILGILTGVTYQADEGLTFSFSWWLLFLVIIIYAVCVYIAYRIMRTGKNEGLGIISRPMWVNMLLMAVSMMAVSYIGNTNAIFHYRMKVEGLLLEGKYDQAMEVGKQSLESDEHLMMLRMFALARQDRLGEHLFEYPITGNSSQILPTNGATYMLLCPTDSLYKFLGARPAEPMNPQRYLQMLQRRDSVPQKAIADYLLCGYLIDRQIDKFAQEISKYYPIDDHLPKHYKEALTIYNHLRSHPVISYSTPVMEEDFSNLQELERQYGDAQERKVQVSEHYRGTYWYYYRYEK